MGQELKGRICTLQGELEITTEAGTGKAAGLNKAGEMADHVERVPFLMLALDLPPAPLYKDALEKNIIPQVSQRWSRCEMLRYGRACRRT